MLDCLRVYWRSEDAVVTIEYSVLLLLIALLASVAADRVGDLVVAVVEDVASFFD